MDQPHDPKLSPPPVDEGRRRLAKAGLAAPAVLGVLASRPVLGNTLHHCTPSGHISGFASPNPGAAPCRVGRPPSYYASSLSGWPPEFLTHDGKPRLFKESPAGPGLILFDDAYERLHRRTTSPATVLDVLAGRPMRDVSTPEPGMSLLTKFNRPHVDIALGQEAIAACMNAMLIPGFPIPPQRVVKMFNAVWRDGKVKVTHTVFWDKAQLKAYFQTLQG